MPVSATKVSIGEAGVLHAIALGVGDVEASAALDQDVAVVAHAEQQRLAAVRPAGRQAGEPEARAPRAPDADLHGDDRLAAHVDREPPRPAAGLAAVVLGRVLDDDAAEVVAGAGAGRALAP